MRDVILLNLPCLLRKGRKRLCLLLFMGSQHQTILVCFLYYFSMSNSNSRMDGFVWINEVGSIFELSLGGIILNDVRYVKLV